MEVQVKVEVLLPGGGGSKAMWVDARVLGVSGATGAEQEVAATALQGQVRQRKAKLEMLGKKQEKNAAVTIQAQYRVKQAKVQMGGMKDILNGLASSPEAQKAKKVKLLAQVESKRQAEEAEKAKRAEEAKSNLARKQQLNKKANGMIGGKKRSLLGRKKKKAVVVVSEEDKEKAQMVFDLALSAKARSLLDVLHQADCRWQEQILLQQANGTPGE
jgi:hypothetical protein